MQYQTYWRYVYIVRTYVPTNSTIGWRNHVTESRDEELREDIQCLQN